MGRAKYVDSGFLELFDRELDSVYAFFTYRLACRSDAEDLTQVTFERALRGWRSFDEGRGSARVWLMAIAHNLLVDHYRADRSGQSRSLDEVDEAHLGTSVQAPSLGLEPELAAALDQLAQREREIVALRFGADLSGPEIAALTDLSLANVQQILSRTLRRLRESLAEEPASA